MTRDQLQARLDAYLAAEIAILKAQDYTIGQGATARRLTRANLAEVQKGIADARAEMAQLDSMAGRPRRVVYLRPY